MYNNSGSMALLSEQASGADGAHGRGQFLSCDTRFLSLFVHIQSCDTPTRDWFIRSARINNRRIGVTLCLVSEIERSGEKPINHQHHGL